MMAETTPAASFPPPAIVLTTHLDGGQFLGERVVIEQPGVELDDADRCVS